MCTWSIIAPQDYKENRDIQATGLVISYGSAVMRGAFPGVDPFALSILTSTKSASAFSREYEIIETSHQRERREREREGWRERGRFLVFMEIAIDREFTRNSTKISFA